MQLWKPIPFTDIASLGKILESGNRDRDQPNHDILEVNFDHDNIIADEASTHKMLSNAIVSPMGKYWKTIFRGEIL